MTKHTEHIPSLEQDAPKRERLTLQSLFEDLSIAQVSAGALAAVTSMLLASQIGIAGSVVGVAVGSVVSAVASQVYRKFLSVSADRIKDLTPLNHAVRDDAFKGDSTLTARFDASSYQTQTLNAYQEESFDSVDDRHTLDRNLYLEHVRAQQKRNSKRIMVVAIVSALIAMLLSAGAVFLLTEGQGLGSKPMPIVQAFTPSDTTTVPESVHNQSSSKQQNQANQSSHESKDGTSSSDTAKQQQNTSEGQGQNVQGAPNDTGTLTEQNQSTKPPSGPSDANQTTDSSASNAGASSQEAPKTPQTSS